MKYNRKNPKNQIEIGSLIKVKVWPVLVLKAITRNLGGAARIYFIARYIDHQGSGWVNRSDLIRLLDNLGIGKRKQRRWIRQALKVGLLIEGNHKYSLVSLGRGAALLGCDVGLPATLEMGAFVKPGWRSYVWGAYIATTKDRPISQMTMQEITGIDPRTQRNYQATLSIEVRRNYAKTDLKGAQECGLKILEEGKAAFVGKHDGKVIYRLPDERRVPVDVAEPAPRGRSRKAQKIVNNWCSMAPVKGDSFRLFHEKHSKATAMLRKLAKSDLHVLDRPKEIFEIITRGKDTSLWYPVTV